VSERDVEGLASRISELLRSPETRARLGDQARKDVITNHGWARAAEAFERAYRQAGLPFK